MNILNYATTVLKGWSMKATPIKAMVHSKDSGYPESFILMSCLFSNTVFLHYLFEVL